MSIALIDFDDSFTYNIASELFKLGREVDIFNYKNLNEVAKDICEYQVVIWGPGPGHPEEYQKYFESLLKIKESSSFNFCICLGHQIFWNLEGASIMGAKDILHGQSIQVNTEALGPEFPKQMKVQRYNSLSIDQSYEFPRGCNIILDDSCDIQLVFDQDKFLTCQFHPESVGTNFPEAFFRIIAEKSL